MRTWIEQAIRRRRSRLESAYPPSFVWHEHRKRPTWTFTCCVALGCGAGGYYLATLSNPVAREQARSDLTKAELTTGVQEKANNQKPDAVAAREETRVPVPPVVILNPGTADSGEKAGRPKTTSSSATVSSSRAAPGARRSGDDSERSSRSHPTSYRSYKDLRDFTLNR